MALALNVFVSSWLKTIQVIGEMLNIGNYLSDLTLITIT